MIQSIVHKGLRLLYEKGNSAKLPAEYVPKIVLMLDALDAVTEEADIAALGMGVHRLTGSYAGFWAVKISPNYRIVFRLHQGDIYDVDYLDFH